jgi:hypothetical protein
MRKGGSKMSDEVQPVAPAPAEGGASLANAMFAVKELRDEVGSLKTQLKSLWATVIVVAVLVVAMAVITLLPRFFGISVLGGGFRGQGRGQFQQQNAPGAPGGQNAPGATAPGH